MEILKNAKEQIATIFEVLLYDPLHNWSISPEKAYMLQRNQNEHLSDVTVNLSDSPIVLNDASLRSNANAVNADTSTTKSSLFFYYNIEYIEY